MIRLATTKDLPALRRIAEETGMFVGDELDGFLGMASAHVAEARHDAALLIAEREGDAVGAAYVAAETMAQGVANILFLGVAASARRSGSASALIESAESFARDRGDRLVIVETGSDADFAAARALYLGLGYDEEARIRDYYLPGLDKIVFRKAL